MSTPSPISPLVSFSTCPTEPAVDLFNEEIPTVLSRMNEKRCSWYVDQNCATRFPLGTTRWTSPRGGPTVRFKIPRGTAPQIGLSLSVQSHRDGRKGTHNEMIVLHTFISKPINDPCAALSFFLDASAKKRPLGLKTNTLKLSCGFLDFCLNGELVLAGWSIPLL